MLDRTSQVRIGRHLRAMYEGMPKGGIPERLWKLLLSVEQIELRKKARADRRERKIASGQAERVSARP